MPTSPVIPLKESNDTSRSVQENQKGVKEYRIQALLILRNSIWFERISSLEMISLHPITGSIDTSLNPARPGKVFNDTHPLG
jgi:hypothetical protein